ncbi:hypothetical protein V202x_47750 [Gimesia aquarii]|uniref:Uncharacterized protein n=1 Tax=Gimesia aquarii TaxID=2527964 RepID=A0A517X1I0_9PLAN|nr:hypothetical protein V144x_31730 [Gimesia aquarii]QDU11354.1 hypothetical protein V202x_47750 [Gimesia aquarii]
MQIQYNLSLDCQTRVTYCESLWNLMIIVIGSLPLTDSDL